MRTTFNVHVNCNALPKLNIFFLKITSNYYTGAMEVLYEKYENLQKFIIDYRQYTTDDTFYDFKTFKKTLQVEQYIKHTCMKNTLPVHIYMFSALSKFTKTTAQFKRLLDKLPETPSRVIVITKEPLSIYINKALLKYTHLKVSNYQHKRFSIEISKGPLCSRHTVLTDAEVRTLCDRDLIIHPLSLPSIALNDAQNIWVGGELGQVIKIDSVSEIAGRAIRYRIVSPDSGKLVQTKQIKAVETPVVEKKENTSPDDLADYADASSDDEE
jgi:DNA-directed RNA polymerase subunit H (RpoH/RPB5)